MTFEKAVQDSNVMFYMLHTFKAHERTEAFKTIIRYLECRRMGVATDPAVLISAVELVAPLQSAAYLMLNNDPAALQLIIKTVLEPALKESERIGAKYLANTFGIISEKMHHG